MILFSSVAYGSPIFTWEQLRYYFQQLITDYSAVITAIVAISVAVYLVRGIVRAVRP